jgi:hypothetical protein
MQNGGNDRFESSQIIIILSPAKSLGMGKNPDSSSKIERFIQHVSLPSVSSLSVLRMSVEI